MKTQELPHTRNTTNHRKRVSINFPEKGRTKQSHKNECDINIIMQKYQKFGVINHVNKHQANYSFCTSNDLHESLNLIKTANDMFDDLPSQARTKFKNSPAEFLDFVQDPNNQDQLFDLGLSDYPVEAEIIPPVEKVTPPIETIKEEVKIPT